MKFIFFGLLIFSVTINASETSLARFEVFEALENPRTLTVSNPFEFLYKRAFEKRPTTVENIEAAVNWFNLPARLNKEDPYTKRMACFRACDFIYYTLTMHSENAVEDFNTVDALMGHMLHVDHADDSHSAVLTLYSGLTSLVRNDPDTKEGVGLIIASLQTGFLPTRFKQRAWRALEEILAEKGVIYGLFEQADH